METSGFELGGEIWISGGLEEVDDDWDRPGVVEDTVGLVEGGVGTFCPCCAEVELVHELVLDIEEDVVVVLELDVVLDDVEESSNTGNPGTPAPGMLPIGLARPGSLDVVLP